MKQDKVMAIKLTLLYIITIKVCFSSRRGFFNSYLGALSYKKTGNSGSNLIKAVTKGQLNLETRGDVLGKLNTLFSGINVLMHLHIYRGLFYSSDRPTHRLQLCVVLIRVQWSTRSRSTDHPT